MDSISKFVLVMAILRFISGSIEVLAGISMIRVNEIEKALIINASLAIVGPIILILSTSIGLIGISDKLSYTKIVLIFTGIMLIIIGLRK